MNESPQNFNNADDDSEITITTPRFDAAEARRAHPVVPLDAVRRTHTDVGKAHAIFRRGGRRWPLSVLAVALLAVVTVGGITTTVLRRANKAQPSAASSIDASAILQANAVQAAVAAGSRDEARASRAPRRLSAAGEPRSERVEESHPASEILRRVVREGFEGEDRRDEDDKGRGKRRKHDEDDEGRESRKDSKRAKKGAARLVDILTGPR